MTDKDNQDIEFEPKTASTEEKTMSGTIERKGQLVINIAIILAVATLSVVFFATRQRVVYVDTAAILNQSTIALEAQSVLETKIGEFQAEIAKKEQEIIVLRDVYDMSDNKATIQAELEERIASYEEYMETVQDEFNELQNETMTPVYAAINSALVQYGLNHRYHLILGATNAGNIVYGQSSADITRDVINYVNQQPRAAVE